MKRPRGIGLELEKSRAIPLPLIQKRLNQWASKFPSQRAAALAAKVSPTYFNEMLLGGKPISDSVLKLIGIRRVVVYEEIEK